MIKINDLHYQYDQKLRVFDGLNLEIQPGQILGILGKNGVGKSTLLRCICGLLLPKHGSITLNNVSVSDRKPSMLSTIFFLPEEVSMPNVTPQKYADIYSRFYPTFDNLKYKNCIEDFDIPYTYKLDEMSYGQKKKTMISFGLACNTKVLIMDEPTNGLDITSKSQFRKIISQAIRTDNCILISTHQIRDVENLVDRILILNEGKVLLDENLEKIAKTLQFGFAHELEAPHEILFSEESLRGYHYIKAGDGVHDSKVDIELLYKAIMHHPQLISQTIYN